jgi:hypothetical protein
MKFLFVHSWQGFSLAEWHLREAVNSRCRSPVDFYSIDLPPARIPAQDILPHALASLEPEVTGFSCYYWNMHLVPEATRQVKQILPKSGVILGGPQVHSERCAREYMERHKEIDAVMIGRAEESLPAYLDYLQEPGDVTDLHGVLYRDAEGQIRYLLPRTVQKPRGIIFHRENHELAALLEKVREVSYETVSGCRATCSFCMYPEEGLRFVDDDWVKKELTFLCASQVPIIRIADAHFAGTRQRAMDLLKMLAKVNRQSRILIYPDLLHVDEEYVRLMKDANAEPTSIGVQTTNPRALSAINRESILGRIDAMHKILAVFPDTPADVIIGLPKDDTAGLRKTLEDVIDMGFSAINIHRLALFPGTPLSEHADDWRLSTICSEDGQVITSRDWPVSSLGETANLVNAACIIITMTHTRNALIKSGKKASSLLNLAQSVSPEKLFAWSTRIENRSREMLRLNGDELARMILGNTGDGNGMEEAIRHDIDIIGLLNSWPA